MKKFIWTAIIIVLLIAAYVGYLVVKPGPQIAADCLEVKGESFTITYSKEREFLPSCIKIASGTKITWLNQSDRTMEIGADPHPIHTGNREVSGGSFDLPVEPGKTAEVTMTKKGTFGYHDHEHANSTGVIQVQ